MKIYLPRHPVGGYENILTTRSVVIDMSAYRVIMNQDFAFIRPSLSSTGCTLVPFLKTELQQITFCLITIKSFLSCSYYYICLWTHHPQHVGSRRIHFGPEKVVVENDLVLHPCPVGIQSRQRDYIAHNFWPCEENRRNYFILYIFTHIKYNDQPKGSGHTIMNIRYKLLTPEWLPVSIFSADVNNY